MVTCSYACTHTLCFSPHLLYQLSTSTASSVHLEEISLELYSKGKTYRHFIITYQAGERNRRRPCVLAAPCEQMGPEDPSHLQLNLMANYTESCLAQLSKMRSHGLSVVRRRHQITEDGKIEIEVKYVLYLLISNV